MNTREQFEEWSANHEILGGTELHKGINGDYLDVDQQTAWDAWQAAASGATACPGHGRPECATCCWPKGEQLPVGEECDVYSFDGKDFVSLDDASDMMNEIAKLRAGYTAVDMSTAAADGYRDGKSADEVLLKLARRTLWLAFCWNDHNFGPAHVEARQEAESLGIKSLEDANAWLEVQS